MFDKAIQNKIKKIDKWIVTDDTTRNRLASSVKFNKSKYVSHFL